MPDLSDEISDYLEQGWNVVGFSTTPNMAMLLHTVILQKDANLVGVTIGRSAGKEATRSVFVLAPRLAKGK